MGTDGVSSICDIKSFELCPSYLCRITLCPSYLCRITSTTGLRSDWVCFFPLFIYLLNFSTKKKNEKLEGHCLFLCTTPQDIMTPYQKFILQLLQSCHRQKLRNHPFDTSGDAGVVHTNEHHRKQNKVADKSI